MFDTASSWRALGGPHDSKLAQIHRGDGGGAALVRGIEQCQQLLALDLGLLNNDISAGPGLSLRLGLSAAAKIQEIPWLVFQVKPPAEAGYRGTCSCHLLLSSTIWQPEAR